MNLKKLGRCLRVNLLGPGSRLIKKEFTGPRSHKGCETLLYNMSLWQTKKGRDFEVITKAHKVSRKSYVPKVQVRLLNFKQHFV